MVSKLSPVSVINVPPVVVPNVVDASVNADVTCTTGVYVYVRPSLCQSILFMVNWNTTKPVTVAVGMIHVMDVTDT